MWGSGKGGSEEAGGGSEGDAEGQIRKERRRDEKEERE